MSTNRILTGIKPTGTPHVGNYFGTIKPSIEKARNADESFLFIANYHALNQIQDAAELERLTLSIAATWLACGLDTEKTFFYLQSDIPEEIELATVLNSFTPKGWMNKAHAYKAASDKNAEAQLPNDEGINMGLYTYPVLMAADILIFHPNTVPVGRDQIQHVEIARDIAQKINHHYNKELFTLPNYEIEEEVGTIPGIDGRKMSKSYDNVIPIFATHDELWKSVSKIVTDSSSPTDKKNVDGTAWAELYKLVTSSQSFELTKSKVENGEMGWGDAKAALCDALADYFRDMTVEFNRLMANPDEIRNKLREGADKVRPIAKQTMAEIRATMGIL